MRIFSTRLGGLCEHPFVLSVDPGPNHLSGFNHWLCVSHDGHKTVHFSETSTTLNKASAVGLFRLSFLSTVRSAAAASVATQRKLDRMIDATGARAKGRFERLGPI